MKLTTNYNELSVAYSVYPQGLDPKVSMQTLKELHTATDSAKQKLLACEEVMKTKVAAAQKELDKDKKQVRGNIVKAELEQELSEYRKEPMELELSNAGATAWKTALENIKVEDLKERTAAIIDAIMSFTGKLK